ncbi:unnamed protein product [Dovyalis caffra]|uniref:Alpha-1,4 glucan phosphorylase n=1 Tax=Dovyalis caffra TaxID=77055 RepID=A0AAV1QWK0_9ROSI|nr:unnamed protein product [Dovyalis caffra]
MFDVQVKRIHEYKRQLLNIMGIVYRYKKMKEMSPEDRETKYVPCVCIFGGKAFATYVQAKRILKFITDAGAMINHDADIGDLLKVVLVPDYNVSVAEVLIPGSDLSQHISTAGMEASGTSNMKFAMNGCILIGTLDGANVEIREEVGDDNFFLFGAQAHDIAGLRKERAEGKFISDPRFEDVKAFVRSGVFGPYNYEELMGSLEGNEGYGQADYFLAGKDFPSYVECQEKVDEAYKDQKLDHTSSAATERFMNMQETSGESGMFYWLELMISARTWGDCGWSGIFQNQNCNRKATPCHLKRIPVKKHYTIQVKTENHSSSRRARHLNKVEVSVTARMASIMPAKQIKTSGCV